MSLLAPILKEGSLRQIDDSVRIDGDIDINAILGKIINANIKITSVVSYRSSIEDYYLSMMGGGNNA